MSSLAIRRLARKESNEPLGLASQRTREVPLVVPPDGDAIQFALQAPALARSKLTVVFGQSVELRVNELAGTRAPGNGGELR